MAHPVAVAADRHDMAVVDQPVDQSGSHDVVAEDVTPVLKAFVRGEHGRGVLVTTSHELEEEHGVLSWSDGVNSSGLYSALLQKPRWNPLVGFATNMNDH